MKFMDILADLWAYMKERKDHPILFPLTAMWLIIHWDLPYALYTSRMGFTEMVSYVDSGIVDSTKGRHFLVLALIYFLAIPVFKVIYGIYNEILSSLESLISSWQSKTALQAIKAQNRVIEEKSKQVKSNNKALDAQIFVKIAASYNEGAITQFINFYLDPKYKVIETHRDDIKEFNNLLNSLAMPTHRHYDALTRSLQIQVIERLRVLLNLLQSYNEEEAEDNDGAYHNYLKIKDFDEFRVALEDFERDFSAYVENARKEI